jgi:hypothetical protein
MDHVKFEVLTLMNITAALFWNVATSSVVHGCKHFGGILRAEMKES